MSIHSGGQPRADGSEALLSARWFLPALLVAMAIENVVANRIAPDADVAIGLALTASLLGLAWLGGLTRADLGLDRGTWRGGARWGLAGAGVVALAYAAMLAIPPLRDSLSASPDSETAQVLVTSLLVIPLATVIPEELAFRGVLWGFLRRERGVRVATLGSSALFGLWHILPALGGGPANDAVVDVVGSGALGTSLRVLGTVVFTFAAGVVFCELRRRSGSLLAPILLHWAVNGIGVVVVLLA